jgi:predicted DCC family thiol-disulfide oxidoreductase YuxK
MAICVIIYDGTCSFCIRWVNRIIRLDTHHRFIYIPNHTPDLAGRYPQLANVDLDASMYFIDEKGDLFSGAEAFHEVALRLPAVRPVAWLFKLPFAQQAYRWIAAHRLHF